MNDLGSSWYINSDVDNVEVYKITEDMITRNCQMLWMKN